METNATVETPHVHASQTEQAHNASDAALVYQGLMWDADPAGTERIIAKSSSHGVTWVVDLSDGFALWRAFTTEEIFELNDVPAEPFGRFEDHYQATRHAEIVDLQVFRRTARNQGKFAELADPERLDEAAFGGNLLPFSMAASFVDAGIKGLKKATNGSWDLTLNIDSGIPQWLQDSKIGDRAKVGLLSLGQADDPDGVEAKKRIDSVLHRARLRPVDPEFQQWMMARYDNWGLMKAAAVKNSAALEEATAETLRRLCGVPTRSDFKFNLDSVAIFEKIDREYYFDMASLKGVWVNRR